MTGASARAFERLLASTRAVAWRARADDLRFTWVGSPAPRLLGYSRQEWRAPGFWERCLHPDDRSATLAAYHDAVRRAKRGPRAFQREDRVVARDGRIVWVYALVRLARRRDGGDSLAGLFLDVTELARRRDERVPSGAHEPAPMAVPGVAELELERHRHELSRAARAITAGELVGAIAHELKQPLLSMRVNVQAALGMLGRDRPDLALVRESLADAVEENHRASDILRSVHDMVARREPTTEPLELNGLVRGVLRFTTADASARGVAVSCSLDPDLDAVDGDRVQLQQVVLNLVVNAIEASAEASEGRRSLTVETRRSEPGWVELCVRDGGLGLPADTPLRVFEPFYTTKPQGVGLGLAVVRSIVQAHGGRVSAENEPRGGAAFRVALPAVPLRRRDAGRDA
jgi:PAS domain S-box-containing protein